MLASRRPYRAKSVRHNLWVYEPDPLSLFPWLPGDVQRWVAGSQAAHWTQLHRVLEPFDRLFVWTDTTNVDRENCYVAPSQPAWSQTLLHGLLRGCRASAVDVWAWRAEFVDATPPLVRIHLAHPHRSEAQKLRTREAVRHMQKLVKFVQL